MSQSEKLKFKVPFSERETLALEDFLVVDLEWLSKEKPEAYEKIKKYCWRLLRRMWKKSKLEEMK